MNFSLMQKSTVFKDGDKPQKPNSGSLSRYFIEFGLVLESGASSPAWTWVMRKVF